MNWINVDKKLPEPQKTSKTIVILVNSEIYTCEVLSKEGNIYFTTNSFFYSSREGFHGDPRFAKPTHWMPLPEKPNELD